MPRLSIEGALGVAAGVILFILDKMGIGGRPLYIVLFVIAASLCMDSVIRSDWAGTGRRKVIGGLIVGLVYMLLGGWIFLRAHLTRPEEEHSIERTATSKKESQPARYSKNTHPRTDSFASR